MHSASTPLTGGPSAHVQKGDLLGVLGELEMDVGGRNVSPMRP